MNIWAGDLASEPLFVLDTCVCMVYEFTTYTEAALFINDNELSCHFISSAAIGVIAFELAKYGSYAGWLALN